VDECVGVCLAAFGTVQGLLTGSADTMGVAVVVFVLAGPRIQKS
jgi:hypothetical protein